MHRLIGPRGLAALFSLAAAALLAAALLVAARDTSTGRALASPAADAPGNDNFDAPGIIGLTPSPPGQVDLLPWDGVQSTASATLEPGEPAPCGPVGATVWYAFQPNTDGNVEISTAGSDFDTVVAVYTRGVAFFPSPPGADLTTVACNDDTGGPTSLLGVPMTRPVQYYIQVGGKNGATGTLQLHLRCDPACPPSNDDFYIPGYVNLDAFQPHQVAHTVTTAARVQFGEQAPCGNIGATVWYILNMYADATVVADTAGSDFDTVVAVYGSTPDGSNVTPDSLRPIACNDDADSSRARLSFRANAGQPYWIQVGGKGGARGALTLSLACDPACPPYNDRFDGRASLDPPAYAETPTQGASLEPGEPQPCGPTSHTVWYQVSVWGNTSIVIDSTGSDHATVLAAYDAPSVPYPVSFSDLRNIACGERAGNAARLRLAAHGPNRLYWVQAGGAGDASGTLRIHVTCDPEPCPPQNDSSAAPLGATVPWSFPYDSVVDTRGATVESGEPLDCGRMGKTVWYLISAPADVTIAFDAVGSDFETAIAAYEPSQAFSPPGGASERTACAVGEGGQRAHVDLHLRANTGVFVQVGGIDGAGGQLRVHADCVPACPPHNDTISNAAYVIGPFTDDLDTRGATLDPGESTACGGVDATVWYRVPASGAATISIDTTGSDVAAAVALYHLRIFASPPGEFEPAGCDDQDGVASFDVTEPGDYYVQVGGVAGARGRLHVQMSCTGDGCPSPAVVIGPDTGPGPYPAVGGTLAPPETGSGGYLPGSRR